MRKGKIFADIFLLVLSGSALRPISPTSCSPIVREEQNEMASAITIDLQSGKNTAEQKKVVEESPFVCNMSALDAKGRRRHKVVMDRMKAATEEVKELSDGYAFRFQAAQSIILLVSEFVARERLCCPFFTFELVVEREGGPLWLRLRGREGVKDFIKAELGLN